MTKYLALLVTVGALGCQQEKPKSTNDIKWDARYAQTLTDLRTEMRNVRDGKPYHHEVLSADTLSLIVDNEVGTSYFDDHSHAIEEIQLCEIAEIGEIYAPDTKDPDVASCIATGRTQP